jgi:hypothetical protein
MSAQPQSLVPIGGSFGSFWMRRLSPMVCARFVFGLNCAGVEHDRVGVGWWHALTLAW